MEYIDLIGCIPCEKSNWKERGKQAVFLNSNRQMQYTVEALMGDEKIFKGDKFFTGYIQCLERYGIEEQYNEDFDVRIENFNDIIQNYLFVFEPIDVGSNHLRMENVALTIKPSFYEEGMQFVSVPYYTTKEPLDVFLEGIGKRGGARRVLGIEESRMLDYFLWQQEGSPMVYAIGSDEPMGQWQEYIRCNVNKLSTYLLEGYEKKRLIINPRNEDEGLAFVEQSAYTAVVDSLDGKRKIPDYSMPRDVENEKQFLEHWSAIIQSAGFTYRNKDLINFHTALKTGGLLILEGMSGTGKSRLVDFYRQALGLGEKHYKCISVRSSWTDESDLLGYSDRMNELYRPDDEGVVDLIVHAANHPESIHLLCFDEMNLARVEHYFSQFLSVLEMEQDQQFLRLYNPEISIQNKDQYPPSVQLRGNILFVGTINRDESTHHFSDKVLDRANVIRLSVTSLKDLYALSTQERQQQVLTTKCWTYAQYIEMTSQKMSLSLEESEMEALEAIHQLLASTKQHKGIGYRIIRQIDRYLANLPVEQDALSRREAFDLQITQRILSKLRGDAPSFEGILEGTEESTPLMQCLEKYEDASEFAISKETIRQKVKELNAYGYTM